MGTQVLENNKKEGAVEQARERKRRRYSPAVDIVDRGDHLELSADMPGVSENDVAVSVEGSMLTLEGQVHVLEPQGTPLYREFGFGDFYRRFELGSEIDVDHIEANMKNGQLRLRLPKAQPRERKISVKQG